MKMQSTSRLTAFAIACYALLFATAAPAVERQNASPIWGVSDEGGFSTESLYQIPGLDFDLETPGIELVDEVFFNCGIVPESSGMIRVKYIDKVRFREASTGSVIFVTDDLLLRSQPFPDPFDPANQDMLGNLLYAYVTRQGDVTSRLQTAVSLAEDPLDVLCGEEVFPNFGPFGVTIATTTTPARGSAERTLVVGDVLTGSFALKGDPLAPFWDFVHPQEGIGVAKYWALEVSVGAMDKGSILSSKSFNEQAPYFEATPGWSLDFEESLIGDMLGSGDDLIRIGERKDTATEGSRLRRVRYFDVRTGALIGSPVQHAVLD